MNAWNKLRPFPLAFEQLDVDMHLIKVAISPFKMSNVYEGVLAGLI